MDAEITLERYCKKKGIDIMQFPETVWEDMVSEFEDEIDDYLRSCYDAGQFNGYLDNLIDTNAENKTQGDSK
jgi:hypothetical protein